MVYTNDLWIGYLVLGCFYLTGGFIALAYILLEIYSPMGCCHQRERWCCCCKRGDDEDDAEPRQETSPEGASLLKNRIREAEKRIEEEEGEYESEHSRSDSESDSAPSHYPEVKPVEFTISANSATRQRQSIRRGLVRDTLTGKII